VEPDRAPTRRVDDTGPDAWPPASSRRAHHAHGWRPGHSPRNSAKSGTNRQNAATETACTRGGPPVGVEHQVRALPDQSSPTYRSRRRPEKATKFGDEGAQRDLQKRSLGDNHDVESCTDLVQSEGFSNQTLGPVPRHRFPELSRGGNAQSADRQVCAQDEERSQTPLPLDSVVVDALEVLSPPDVLTSGEPGLWSCGAHGYAGSPFGRGGYSLLTVRRLRPFARRRFSTRRPFLVFIRTRKPCALTRRRRFG